MVFPLQTTPPKCVDCRQYLDDPDLKFFQGDPDNAVSGSLLGFRNVAMPLGVRVQRAPLSFSAGGAGDADG